MLRSMTGETDEDERTCGRSGATSGCAGVPVVSSCPADQRRLSPCRGGPDRQGAAPDAGRLLVLGAVWRGIGYAASAFGLPAILVKIATVIIVIAAVLWLVRVLMGGIETPNVP